MTIKLGKIKLLGNIFAAVGGSISKFFFGNGILSTIGRYAGRIAGNYLEQKWFSKKKTTKTTKNNPGYQNSKEGFYFTHAKYGTPIPLIFGQIRIKGEIIWIDKIKEINSFGIKKFFIDIHRSTSVNELEYYASFAMAICEGEITEISRIWLDDELVDISKYKFRLYKGDEGQLPDPLIVKASGNSPAFRDLAYIVFEEIPLADFDNIIPHFFFEVIRKPNIGKQTSVESMVTSMVIIPGSGEFVYDPIIQTKTFKTSSGQRIYTKPINAHNLYKLADSVHSLNQLQLTCENIKWVAPVVCWFGDNINAKDCSIKPAIEFDDPNIEYSEEWQVAGYTRDNARKISLDHSGNPNYGGSVNDASIIRYLRELKSRNLRIMFYPMLFLDVPGKPWRGLLTCHADEVQNFFRKKYGYNEFIIHYANLVKDLVDVFVIGSELIGLTKINAQNSFPAVVELVHLAGLVRQIVGNEVMITYAADWSEYHHTEGGWYNMDLLWSCKNIDFIGIDAYFPVTNSISSIITTEEIAAGWESGEGYDYYIDSNGTKQPLALEYAWKNLRYWWENKHRNPDGNLTDWQPKAKKIWFTEFGFPSIDKASNQPNVFFDPLCTSGGIPRYSNGKINFSIQRQLIRGFLSYWQKQEYIEKMFLWTWDARPYPAWPFTKIWRDNYLWEKGHWVNNKFGVASIANIILEISTRCKINIDQIEVTTVDEVARGVIFSNQISSLNALNILRTAYFFDLIISRDNKIAFIKRGAGPFNNTRISEYLKLSNNSFLERTEIARELILGKIDLYFISEEQNYSTCYCHINNEQNFFTNRVLIKLPIVLTTVEAQQLGRLILTNAANENKVIKFILPYGIVYLEPGNFITLQHLGNDYNIRVINIYFHDFRLEITGIVDDINIYYNIPLHAPLPIANNYPARENPVISSENNPAIDNPTLYNDELEEIATELVILDLPFHLNSSYSSYLVGYLQRRRKAALYGRLNNSDNSDDRESSQHWEALSTLIPSNSIAKLISFNQTAKANIFTVDESSEIIIFGYNLEQIKSSEPLPALVGDEIIGFKSLIRSENGFYKITNLIRGDFGTEQFINTHVAGEMVIFLSRNFNIIPISIHLIERPLIFKVDDKTAQLTFKQRNNHPLPPYITLQSIEDDNLYLAWEPRSQDDNWISNSPGKQQQLGIIEPGIIEPVEERIRDLYKPGSSKFIVTFTTYNYSKKFTTLQNKLTISLTGLDISAGYKLDIIQLKE